MTPAKGRYTKGWSHGRCLSNTSLRPHQDLTNGRSKGGVEAIPHITEHLYTKAFRTTMGVCEVFLKNSTSFKKKAWSIFQKSLSISQEGLSLMALSIKLMCLTGLIAIVGCSHESQDSPEPVVPQTPGTAIVFSASQSEEEQVTRTGTSLHNNGVTRFETWGYKNMEYDNMTDGYPSNGLQTVIPGYIVDWRDNSAATTTTNSSGWDYILTTYPAQTIKYWDWGARAYRFFGATGGLSGTERDYTSYKAYEITMTADASSAEAMAATPYISTLWFSTGNRQYYPTREFGRPVQLEFLKPFARVRFIYKYVYPREGLVLEEQEFKPTTDYTEVEEDKVKIALKGTVTVSYPLTGTATKETYSTAADADKSIRLEKFTTDYDPDDDDKDYSGTGTDNGWYTVFPNANQGSYKLSLRINNALRTCTVPAEYMNWLPGYSYTYVFKINEEGGVEIDMVQSAFIPWVELEGSKTVYNW